MNMDMDIDWVKRNLNIEYSIEITLVNQMKSKVNLISGCPLHLVG